MWFHNVYKSSSIVLPIIKKCELEEEQLTYFSKEMGRKIKDLRDTKYWSQEKLAKQLSVSKEVISSIEEGRAEYCKKITVKLRKFLGDFSW
jgi:ribosome-binding protein aMBF1 (putative translation factor)